MRNRERSCSAQEITSVMFAVKTDDTTRLMGDRLTESDKHRYRSKARTLRTSKKANPPPRGIRHSPRCTGFFSLAKRCETAR